MSLDDATINFVFLGTPGIVCYFIMSKLGRNGVEVFLYLFMFAIVSYVLYAYVARLIEAFGFQNSGAELILATPSSLALRTTDVAFATLIAVVLAYGLAFGYRHNAINRVGQVLKVTNRIGDEDVWHFFHNTSTKPWSSEWIVVRDHKVALQYFGAVSQWSDSGEDRELLLRDVSVFRNSDGQKLYDCEYMYVCRGKDDLTIEIHAAGRGGTNVEPQL